jgi:hypothetical protein
LLEEVERLQKALDVECRLNGMGGSRELALKAEVERLKSGPDGINSLTSRVAMYLDMLKMRDAEIARYREALEIYAKMQVQDFNPCMPGECEWRDLGGLARQALGKG